MKSLFEHGFVWVQKKMTIGECPKVPQNIRVDLKTYDHMNYEQELVTTI